MSYEIENSPFTTYRRWTIDNSDFGEPGFSGSEWGDEVWVGSVIVGQTTGASGIVIGIELGAFIHSAIRFLQISTTAFDPTGETVDVTGSTHSFDLENGGNTKTQSIDTIFVRGTSDIDHGVTLLESPPPSESEGIDSGSAINEFITGNEDDWAVTNRGNLVPGGYYLCIDTDEIIQIIEFVSTNRIKVRRAQLYTARVDHSPGESLHRLHFQVDDASYFYPDDMVHVGDEFQRVWRADHTYNHLLTYREELGSSIDTPASGTPVYQVNDSPHREIYDYVKDQGWGYDACEGAGVRLGCQVFYGDPRQTERSIFLSTEEVCFNAYDGMIVGNSGYNSFFQAGVGVSGEIHKTRFGSRLMYEALSGFKAGNDALSRGLNVSRYAPTRFYSSAFGRVTICDEATLHRVEIAGTPKAQDEGSQSFVLVGETLSYGEGVCDMKDLVLSRGVAGFNTGRGLYDEVLIGDGKYGIFYIASGETNPDQWYISLADIWDYHAFAFIEGGTKKFYDSFININRMSGFWSSAWYENYKTLNITYIAENGSPVEGARVRVINTNGSVVVDVFTDSNGQISQQNLLIQRKQDIAATADSYNPFRILITKAGWADIDFSHTFDPDQQYGEDWTFRGPDVNIPIIGQ